VDNSLTSSLGLV